MVNGTYTIDINGHQSEDENLLAGSGQGDLKSAGLFKLSVAPLNHLLASHPAILSNASPDFCAFVGLLQRVHCHPRGVSYRPVLTKALLMCQLHRLNGT